MKEPALDGRYRDQKPPMTGKIHVKRGDAINKNLPQPIPQFSPNATVKTMREETGKHSLKDIRDAAKDRK
jgi:hypothetical protein